MYLLYPMTFGGYAIYEIPVGKTAEEIATSFGLTMAQCAEFDMADFPPGSSNFQYNFTLVNNQPDPNGVAFDLEGAKESAATLTKANSSTLQQTALNGFSPEVLASQAAIPEVSRIPSVQQAIEQVNVLAVQLEADLAAIAAATSATELSNIAYPPTGILFTGRGSGDGPEDLNVSYYVEFNSDSLTEAETELYVPGTGTTIPYTAGQFDSFGNCFNIGDYLMQIREVATSRVIAEFQVPLNPAGQNVSF